jgi:hypothetical protein
MLNRGDTEEHSRNLGGLPRRITSVLPLLDKNFPRKILHLWKFPVISHLRTNFSEMPGKSLFTREPRTRQGRRGGESESLEEEAIGIGNCNRTL